MNKVGVILECATKTSFQENVFVCSTCIYFMKVSFGIKVVDAINKVGLCYY